MSRSDYKYDVDYENQIIVIKDLNLGRMSVTNNAENVLTEIEHKFNLIGETIIDKKIYYKDSIGKVDEIESIWCDGECTNVSFIIH